MVMEHPYGGVQSTTGDGGLELSLNRTDHLPHHVFQNCKPQYFLLQWLSLSHPVMATGSNEGPNWKQSHPDRESSFLLLCHRSKKPSFSEASVTLGFILMWNNKCFNTIWLAFLCLFGKHLDNTCYFLCFSTRHGLQHFNKSCLCTRFHFSHSNYTLKTT